MQRSRLLAAAVGGVVEHGWEGASIARITQRAGVSRRTFYEMYGNREECLLALLENTVCQMENELADADLDRLAWVERVRQGLWVILCFFDREPALARVCLVESRRGGGTVLDYRQQTIEALARIVDQGTGEAPLANDTVSVTAHGVIGGILEVLYSRLLKTPDQSLRDLLGELMGMIVLPYRGPAAAQREQARPLPVTLEPAKPRDPETEVKDTEDPMVLPMRLTYRTASVLQALAEHPGQSNRQVANRVGIADQGQASKLLSRLSQLGLLTNSGKTKGERNEWVLTPTGIKVTRSIQSYALSANTEKQAT